MIDLRFSWIVFYIVILCFIFPFLPLLIDPFLMLTAVRAIENIQALLLFGIFVFTLLYMQPWKLADGKKHFWFWAAAWWLMLCGRSTSWGRDYFPDVPKIYFRMISIVLIGTVVFMLCSKHLRSEIMLKLKHLSLPFWPLLLAVSGLIISDAVEHLRGVYHIFVLDLK